jgi:hypothetical protein
MIDEMQKRSILEIHLPPKNIVLIREVRVADPLVQT